VERGFAVPARLQSLTNLSRRQVIVWRCRGVTCFMKNVIVSIGLGLALGGSGPALADRRASITLTVRYCPEAWQLIPAGP